MLSIKIDNNLYSTYNQIRLGIIHFKSDVKEPNLTFWKEMDEKVIPSVLSDIKDKNWSEIKGINGTRNAYKAFGRDPTRYRVSSEALLRRIKRGDKLYQINSVVDVNNRVSIESGLSIGSYDLDKIEGDITFTASKSGECYTGIGKDIIDLENLLVLKDEKGPFGSTMSDSTRTMVTLDSKNILVIIYCFQDDIDLDSLVKIASDLFIKYSDAKNLKSYII